VLAVGDDGRTAETGDNRLTTQDVVGGRLIAGFTRQLEGRMDVCNQHGTRIEIHMPLPQVA
jgi:two-component sensor histidine kinase